MKLYTFYQIIPGLEPLFYAYTNNKKYAKEFKERRKKLYDGVKEVSSNDYKGLRSDVPSLEIIPHEFKTRGSIGVKKVVQLCTNKEAMDMVLFKEEIMLRELTKYAKIPSEIFSPKLRKCLEFIGYLDTEVFSNEVLPDPDHHYDGVTFDRFNIDELSIFSLAYQQTM